MQQQKPTIGRVVHYTNLGDADGKYPPEVQMAFVTGVYRETAATETALAEGSETLVTGGCAPANKVGDLPNSMRADLLIIYRAGEFRMTSVPFSEEPKRGHWNWPPRAGA